MQLYAITDRRLYPGGEHERQAALLAQAGRWIAAGVELIQLREKDLADAALESLAARLVEAAQQAPVAGRSRILINAGDAGRSAAIARHSGADGVHLPEAEALYIEPHSVEAVHFRQQTDSDRGRGIVSAACHSSAQVASAARMGAGLILFAPVFEKPLGGGEALPLPGVGLTALREACRAAGPTPVYALGGVTVGNAAECLAAGAAGVAGIRLFAGEDWTMLANPASHQAL